MPEDLRTRPQWVVWRYEERKSKGKSKRKPTKVPYCASKGERANVTDPATWCSFVEAIATYKRGGYDGIGYVFADDDPFCGIDLDGCYELGGLSPRVASWIAEAGSYAERSPSGQGVKIFVRARLNGPGTKSQRLGLEIYDRDRFFTVTGDQIKGSPSVVAEAQSTADEIYRIINPAPHPHLGRDATGRAIALPKTSDVASLAPGGALRRPDGTLRRLRPGHWLNAFLLGDDRPYLELAGRRGWDIDDSAVRFHAFESLWHFGYPEAEIATIARALLPQGQPGRDTDRWWGGEISRCLYGPMGAATRWPDIPRNPTRASASGTPETAPVPSPGGRPQLVNAAELLRYYEEESGKRLLEGPRKRDAEALGISIPTLDRLDRQLREQGLIEVEKLPKNAGRMVRLMGAIKTPLVEIAEEVLSGDPPAADDLPVLMPCEGIVALQCIGEDHSGTLAAPPPVPHPIGAADAVEPEPAEVWADRWRQREEARHQRLVRGYIPPYNPMAEPLKFERHLQTLPSRPPASELSQAPLRLIPPELADLAAVLEAATLPEPNVTPPQLQLALVEAPASPAPTADLPCPSVLVNVGDHAPAVDLGDPRMLTSVDMLAPQWGSTARSTLASRPAALQADREVRFATAAD